MFTMIAKTLFGFEDITAQELKNLGAKRIQIGNRMVSYQGDQSLLYKTNLCLRSALKILKPIRSKKIKNTHELYRFVQEIDWSLYLDPGDSFMVTVTAHSAVFRHSHFVVQKVKDAIVDQCRDQYKERPNVDTNNPDISVHVHIQEQWCNLSLDSSGDSLHRRGYRSHTDKAPINEVLAASILLRTGWNGETDFLDPMCGSGTFAIEAAMIAANMPPLRYRKTFAFEKWKDWNLDHYNHVEQECLRAVQPIRCKIMASDQSISVTNMAAQNIRNAKLSDYISLSQNDFFESTKPGDKPLHIVFNPPYDERLKIGFEDFYQKIGDTLKKEYPDTSAWLVTANLESLKHLGLRASKKIKVFNGALESRLVNYLIYKGSKKGMPTQS